MMNVKPVRNHESCEKNHHQIGIRHGELLIEPRI